MRHDHYTPSNTPHLFKFTWSEFSRERERETKHWEYMQAERLQMFTAMQELLNSIREKFPEIDIQEESDAAAKRYDAEIAQINEHFERRNSNTTKKSKPKSKGNKKKKKKT